MSRVTEWLGVALLIWLHIITIPFFVVASIIDRVRNGEPR